MVVHAAEIHHWRDTVPWQLTSLLGREREIAIVRGKLRRDDVRLVTLIGTGGIGKTRLALEVASAVSREFADGVWVVELEHARDPSEVFAAVAEALHLGGSSALAPLECVLRYLRERHALLVLDNFEHVLPAARDLTTLVGACPQVKLLVTSREPLHFRWEHTVAVGPLPVPNLDHDSAPSHLAETPCIQLFVQRAAAVKHDFELHEKNAWEIVEICTRLDGIPLAVELAAARLNALSPAAILAQLDRRLRLPRRRDPDVVDRHRSMEEAISWSYDLLVEHEKRLFRRLAVFTAGFTIAAAQEVAGFRDLGPDGLDGILALVDKGLIYCEEVEDGELRYRFLEPIRDYAADLLSEHEEQEAAEGRHLAYFLSLAEQAAAELTGQNWHLWLSKLDRELGNVRGAFRHAIHYGDEDAVLRLGTSLTWFWYLRGHVLEGARWLEEGLSSNPQARPELRIRALDGLGLLLYWQGRAPEAKPLLEEAVRLARGLDDPALLGPALSSLGWLTAVQEDLHAGGGILQEAVDMCRSAGDEFWLARSMQTAGIVEFMRGRAEQAEQLFSMSLDLFERTGFGPGVAAVGILLARVCADEGQLKQALETTRRSVELSRGVIGHTTAYWSTDMVAWLTAKRVDPGPIARLLGGVDGLCDATGFTRDAYEQVLYDEAIESLQRRMGRARFYQEWSAGRATPIERLVDNALLVVDEALKALNLSHPASGVSRSAPLTAREFEVLRLVAHGLSNVEIAAELCISRNTVKYHVTAILNRLGAGSRAEAVAIAAKRHLLGEE